MLEETINIMVFVILLKVLVIVQGLAILPSKAMILSPYWSVDLTSTTAVYLPKHTPI